MRNIVARVAAAGLAVKGLVFVGGASGHVSRGGRHRAGLAKTALHGVHLGVVMASTGHILITKTRWSLVAAAPRISGAS